MKTENKPHYLIMAFIVAVVGVATWSCNKDDDPSLSALREDKLQYLEDSLRIRDSLMLTNNAGVVNYGVVVVDASASSIFRNGNNFDLISRNKKTQSAVSGAIVTISQYGKTVTDTTDASGIVVFKGFFRSAVTVTIEKAGFTKVSYIAAVHIQDSTRTGTISFVGNLIPIFPTSGTGTATISGIATIESDLTNATREVVPAGTTFTATIDATDNDFSDRFLTTGLDGTFTTVNGHEFVYVGDIKQASYQAVSVGATGANGAYSITVPAAVDGLPLTLQYADIALNQTLYGVDTTQVVTRRVVFDTDNPIPAPYSAINTPSAALAFSATKFFSIDTKPHMVYINDIYYGTGTTRY